MNTGDLKDLLGVDSERTTAGELTENLNGEADHEKLFGEAESATAE